MIIPRPFDAAAFPVTVAFTSRLGGSSVPPYDGLNLAFHVGDSSAAVAANRREVANALGVNPERITTCRQVHGSTVKLVDAGYVGRGALEPAEEVVADSLVTNIADTPLLILTADCVPVVIADITTRAIAAIHAGRRGLVAGIIGETIAAMVETYGSRPHDMKAFIGPCVHRCCYEVDAGTAAEFGTVFPQGVSDDFLDLPGSAAEALGRAGLPAADIIDIDICTHCHPELFFSYRRDPVTGRQGTIVAAKRVGTFTNKR